MLQPDAYLKAVAAGVSLSFALAVLLGGPRRPQNVFLAMFLAAIGGNQAAETLRAAAPGLDDIVLWFRVATVFAAVDPLLLYYFASIFPERNALNAAPRVALVMAGSAAFAFSAVWLTPLELHDPVAMGVLVALTLFTTLVYTLVLVATLRAVPPDREDASTLGFLVAVSLAAVPLWSRAAGQLVPGDVPQAWRLAVMTLALAAGTAGALRFVAGRPLAPRARRVVRQGILGGALLAAVLVAAEWAAAQPPSLLQAAGLAVGRGAASIRWLLFGAFVSMAALRGHMLGMSMAARRRAARVLLGVAIAALAFILLATVQTALRLPPLTFSPIELALVAAAVLFSQGFRALIDGAATRVYGVPAPGDAAAAHDAYQRAVEQAIAAGRSPASDAELARLRGELGIGEATARALERLTETRPQGPLEVGRVVAGRYRLVRLLGRGGSGQAFLARDELLSRDVAVKEARLGSEAALAEAKLAAGLRHERVVALHDVVERPGGALLVSEYVEGGTLAERVARDGPLPFAPGVAVVADVLSGLAAAHRAGVIHRDVKPANVLLTRDGRAKLTDFGLARALDDTTVRLSEVDAFLGTPGFMAPEQRLGLPTSPATDVHQVGLLARAALAAPLPPPVEAVVQRALRLDPAARWRDAGEMLSAWEDAARASRREHQDAAPHADEVPVAERD